ncbi:hypothetical protein CN307_09730 [Bacillus cereus]|uniref:Uncharacterized protein n=1 Tax=Bacillus cereus TaxID=1396 RepID=A0A2A9A4L2_BACCE|nr:hypothetical protein CN307_09730 [Bacillus cereus]
MNMLAIYTSVKKIVFLLLKKKTPVNRERGAARSKFEKYERLGYLKFHIRRKRICVLMKLIQVKYLLKVIQVLKSQR